MERRDTLIPGVALAKLILVLIALLPAWATGRPHFAGELLSWSQVYELAAVHAWPAARMTDVFVLCESLGYTRAVSPTLDVGLAQVSLKYHAATFDVFRLIYDPVYNMAAAAQIFDAGGESRWMCAAEVAPRG
jgi:hypothetical protein